MSNDHEARARARKAFKISRILVHAVREGASLDDFAASDSANVRETAARAAGTRIPSDQTWAMACDLAREQLEADEETT